MKMFTINENEKIKIKINIKIVIMINWNKLNKITQKSSFISLKNCETLIFFSVYFCY